MAAKEEILKLFSKRIALIVDDDVSKEGTQAERIKEQFEEGGMVFTTYKDIPSKNQWGGLSEISFALIDWNLKGIDLGELGISSPYGMSGLGDEEENRVIEFIAELMSKYLVPVIIFTQENPEYVTGKLIQSDIVRNYVKQGQVIVHHKDELAKEKIEEILFNWCRNNPSVYALISISNSINVAKIGMFAQLGAFDKKWPAAIYKTLEADNPEDINQEFAEFMISSLVGRIDYPLYDKSIFDVTEQFDEGELIKIYSDAKLYKYNIQPLTASTGDLYIYQEPGKDDPPKEFYLNITAECDIRKGQYLFIKGNACDEIHYDAEYGLINRSTSNYIPMLCDNICVEFKFSTYKRKRLNNVSEVCMGSNKDKKQYRRVGRLMHPYITEIQERFSSYISRHGIIRHPDYILAKLSPKQKMI